MTDEQIKEIMVLVFRLAYCNYSFGFEAGKSGQTVELKTLVNKSEQLLSAVESALRAAVPDSRIADPFTYIIQHLNSDPYNLTKDECVELIKKLRFFYASPQQAPQAAQPKAGIESMIGVGDEKPLEIYSTHCAVDLITGQPQAAQPAIRQALTDPENQPNQYGFACFMRGQKMAFKIGNQTFTLDYEPDETEEFDFMRDMLANAFSTFTPDVKTAQQAVAVLKPEPVANWNNERQSELNDWFLSLPEGRQKVLTDDKWMLAGAAFMAGKSEQVRKPLTKDEIADLWDGTLFHITDLSTATDFVRAIEAAHNIREN